MMWFLLAPLRLSLPLAVTLNRFFAPLWVFIFGMIDLPSHFPIKLSLPGRRDFPVFTGGLFGRAFRRGSSTFSRSLHCGRRRGGFGRRGFRDGLHMVLHRSKNRGNVSTFLNRTRFRESDTCEVD